MRSSLEIQGDILGKKLKKNTEFSEKISARWARYETDQTELISEKTLNKSENARSNKFFIENLHI